MTRDEFAVHEPRNGEITFSVKHPNNEFTMSTDGAVALAKSILKQTGELDE